MKKFFSFVAVAALLLAVGGLFLPWAEQDIESRATERISITCITEGNDSGYCVDAQGLKIDLDTDNNTSISAATSDTMVFEVGGSTFLTLTNPPSAGASGDMFDITKTILAMNGSDAVKIFDINVTNADHSSTGNTLRVFDISGITGDAEATESAVFISTGWDFDLDGQTSLEIGVDSVLVATLMDPPAAGAGGDSIDATLSLGTSDGADDDYHWMDVNITGSGTEEARDAVGIDLDWTDGADGDILSYGLQFQDGWDLDINATTNLLLGVDGGVVLTIMDPPAANASGDGIDFTNTLLGFNGDDVYIFLDVNLTGGAATGTGNKITGIDLNLATPDAQQTETALIIGGSWDYAVDTSLPVITTAQTWFEDFLGSTVSANITLVSGTDAQAVQAIAVEQFGIYQITSGDDGTNCAADCEGINMGLEWQVDQGNMVFEARLHLDDVDNFVICFGITDTAALEMPATIGGSDVVTDVADDFVAFCYDTAADTDQWFALGNAAGTFATGNGATGVAPTINVNQVFRIEIDAAGADARFYIDGTLVKTLTAGVITVTDPVTPFIVVDTNAAESNVVDVDYMYLSSGRN